MQLFYSSDAQKAVCSMGYRSSIVKTDESKAAFPFHYQCSRYADNAPQCRAVPNEWRTVAIIGQWRYKCSRSAAITSTIAADNTASDETKIANRNCRGSCANKESIILLCHSTDETGQCLYFALNTKSAPPLFYWKTLLDTLSNSVG